MTVGCKLQVLKDGVERADDKLARRCLARCRFAAAPRAKRAAQQRMAKLLP